MAIEALDKETKKNDLLHNNSNNTKWSQQQAQNDQDEEDIGQQQQQQDPLENNLGGTSLTDIYPVYRQKSDSTTNSHGQWHRLPALLLVKGDLLALQIGDMAPAKCQLLLVVGGQGNHHYHHPITTILQAGERVTIETVGETMESTRSQLPRGRCTLTANSNELLTLCNMTQIFVVLETPIQSFLTRPRGKQKTFAILYNICFHSQVHDFPFLSKRFCCRCLFSCCCVCSKAGFSADS